MLCCVATYSHPHYEALMTSIMSVLHMNGSESQVSNCDKAFRLKLAKKHAKFITLMTFACLVRSVHEKYLV